MLVTSLEDGKRVWIVQGRRLIENSSNPLPCPLTKWLPTVGENLRDAWWISVYPGITIFLMVMSLNFLGDWLRDRIDPRLRQL